MKDTFSDHVTFWCFLNSTEITNDPSSISFILLRWLFPVVTPTAVSPVLDGCLKLCINELRYFVLLCQSTVEFKAIYPGNNTKSISTQKMYKQTVEKNQQPFSPYTYLTEQKHPSQTELRSMDLYIKMQSWWFPRFNLISLIDSSKWLVYILSTKKSQMLGEKLQEDAACWHYFFSL